MKFHTKSLEIWIDQRAQKVGFPCKIRSHIDTSIYIAVYACMYECMCNK